MSKSINRMNNRTGGMLQPNELKKTIQGAQNFSPLSEGDAQSLNMIRWQYADDAAVLGTMPPPPPGLQPEELEIREDAKQKGFLLLIDKLSERIAFESTGTRLYESLMSKCELSAELPEGMTLQELQHIRDEEHEHLLMLLDVVEQLGADPTVVSPAADAQATATSGLCKVIGDPRSTIAQALDAILIAELTDNDGWTILINICEQLKMVDLVQQFERALEQEEEHLEKVRTWISEIIAPKSLGGPRPRFKRAGTMGMQLEEQGEDDEELVEEPAPATKKRIAPRSRTKNATGGRKTSAGKARTTSAKKAADARKTGSSKKTTSSRTSGTTAARKSTRKTSASAAGKSTRKTGASAAGGGKVKAADKKKSATSRQSSSRTTKASAGRKSSTSTRRDAGKSTEKSASGTRSTAKKKSTRRKSK